MKPMNDHAQAPVRIPKPRRDYKDTLFRLLFQDRDRLLSLYNAVNGTSYDSPEELTVRGFKSLFLRLLPIGSKRRILRD